MSLLLLLSQPNLASNPNDSTGLTDAGQAYGREGATSDDRGPDRLGDDAKLTSGTNWTQSLTDRRASRTPGRPGGSGRHRGRPGCGRHGHTEPDERHELDAEPHRLHGPDRRRSGSGP